jgi:uncharacterized protein
MVLLGFVKDVAHWQWIQDRMTYNVRTEGRPGGLAANAELLYSQLLLLLTEEIQLSQVSAEDVERLATSITGRRGQPVGVRWGYIRTALGLGL